MQSNDLSRALYFRLVKVGNWQGDLEAVLDEK